MAFSHARLTAQDVRRHGDLARLREAIEKSVPLSAGKYNQTVRDAGTAARIVFGFPVLVLPLPDERAEDTALEIIVRARLGQAVRHQVEDPACG